MHNFLTVMLVDGMFVLCGLILIVSLGIILTAVGRNCISHWWHEREQSLKRVSEIGEEYLKTYN